MSKQVSSDDASIFQVSGSMAFFSWLICGHPNFWKKIGRLETSVVEDAIESLTITKPVYVSGLARSGSTILLEILAQVPGVVSHLYKDFPPVFTPYAWNKLLAQIAPAEAKPAERAHKDGILVTLDSPEAMEEPLWMSFFPQAHDPKQSNVINAGDADNGFGDFYPAHIRKLLAVRGGDRYLAKANYQITRLEYLLSLFPDANFVVPVREPAAHIASLVKQHDLFARGQRANERARQHLRRVGHYEFGLDRAPINTGNNERTAEILQHWERGEELVGWAKYWDQIYGYLLERLEANPQLAAATQLIVFEDLCADPATRLADLMTHCGYEVSAEFMQTAAGRIKAPTYYQSKFSDTELAIIAAETRLTMDRIRAAVR
jgi:hypothetical protein